MNSIRITLPANLKELGNRISRSLEPDSGGYHVFDTLSNAVRDEDGVIEIPATEVYAEIPSCERYVSNLISLICAEDLHVYVSNDYAARWPSELCPTLTDCETFWAAMQIEEIA
jgi:hypothetical protein